MYTVHMSRYQIFVTSLIVLLSVSVVMLVNIVQTTPVKPSDTDTHATNTYTTFSSPFNVFESLKAEKQNSNQPIYDVQENSEQTIESIINTWETRLGSNDARTIQTNYTNQQTQHASTQTESEEIATLFNDLIGTTIFDKMAQQSDFDTNSDKNDSLWFGNYTNSQIHTETGSETETQLALREYANTLGALLKSFDIAQGNQVALLENFVADRTTTHSLKQLTDAYEQLSLDISQIDAPEVVSSIHTGLIISYKAVGELLWELTLAHDDTELMERMLIYNQSSEDVAKQHVSLITLLKAYGIEFKSSEAGSIFSFSPTL